MRQKAPPSDDYNCPECDNLYCCGPGQLREFESWADLASHLSEEEILEAVNGWAKVVGQRRVYGKKFRTKQQLLAQLMKKRLDPDELERIEKIAEEKAGEI